MTRFRTALVALAAMFAVLASVGVTAPAHASDVGVLGCQVSRLYVYPYTGPPSSYNCSGTYGLSVIGPTIVTNGWSGTFVVSGRTYYYCDWESHSFPANLRITQVWLSPTRTSWC